tara:strand:- start:212 stop:550 length:339 start_codon:yes stop_codon:yes gene_type:complete
MNTETKTWTTAPYQRRAYSNYVKRKNNKEHESYDPSFREKVKIHQKIYYQRKKKRSLTARLDGLTDQFEINQINNQIQKCDNLVETLIDFKAKKYNYASSSDGSDSSEGSSM